MGICLLARNIILSIFIVAYFCVIAYKWKKPCGVIFSCFALLTFLGLILPNFPVIVSLRTPPIRGRVTDFVTKKPIANCNIIASWKTQTVFIAGAGKDTYHQFYTKSDINGDYEVPSYFKPLTLINIWVIRNGFGGIDVEAYTHGYNIGASGIDEQGKRFSPDISLTETNPLYIEHTISTLEAIFNSKNYKSSCGHRLSYGISSYDEITKDDRRYILEECKIFDVKLRELVKTHKYKDTMIAMEDLGRYYERLGEANAAQEVKKRTKQIFPDPSKVQIYVREEDVQLF